MSGPKKRIFIGLIVFTVFLITAVTARGMYYQWLTNADPVVRDKAITIGKNFEKLEPEIFERIVAVTYLVSGSEHLWIARLYAILFSSVGGLGLFFLSRRISSLEGAILALAFYFVLPYGVSASRSFQPDVLMTTVLIWSGYALYRWGQEKSWSWTILAGILSGLAVLVKVFAVFPVACAAIFTVIAGWSVRRAVSEIKVWITAGFMGLIPGLYFLGTVNQRAPEYLSGWVLHFSEMLV